jgi:C1A family cysteine protease
LEGIVKIKRGFLPELSVQQILDCSGSSGNQGCRGGFMDNSFNYLKTHKLQSHADYPYKSTTGSCKDKSGNGIVSTSGYVKLPAKDPDALLKAVAQQPVSVAVASSTSAMFFYKGGIISGSKCDGAVNHAVLAIGYGHDAATGMDYWIVKNSWGSSWGENGFFRVQRTTARNSGVCGILSQYSVYPTIN